MLNTGVDVILDCVGAAYLQRNLDSLNFDGRLCIIGLQSGAVTEIKLHTLFPKRLTVQGTAGHKQEIESIVRKHICTHPSPSDLPVYPTLLFCYNNVIRSSLCFYVLSISAIYISDYLLW